MSELAMSFLPAGLILVAYGVFVLYLRYRRRKMIQRAVEMMDMYAAHAQERLAEIRRARSAK
jgi:hypothetical protein